MDKDSHTKLVCCCEIYLLYHLTLHILSQVVSGLADTSCNIIFGAVVDEAYEGIINVTIIGEARALSLRSDRSRPHSRLSVNTTK